MDMRFSNCLKQLHSPRYSANAKAAIFFAVSIAVGLFTTLSSAPSVAAGAHDDAELANGKIHRGSLDGFPVKFIVVNGNAISEGDILLGSASVVLARMRSEAPDGKFPASNVALKAQAKGHTYGGANRLWPRNAQGVVEVPYVITLDPNNNVPAAITAANAQLAPFMQWIPRTGQNDYVSFNLSEDENYGSCFSSVGRVGGSQNIGGSNICGTGTLVHEMGHAIGLWHEQQRADRNTWLNIDRANIDPSYVNNYDAPLSQRDFGGFDYGSIMHYSAYSFVKVYKPSLNTIPAGIPIGARSAYSKGDLEAIRRLYDFVEQTITIDSFPSGQKVIIDGVLSATPAVVNWAIGSTHSLSVPAGVVNTSGNLYTFARWNNDQAATLNPNQTITVTAGDGSLGQPANRPVVSTYTAHFSQVVEVKSSTTVTGGVATLLPAPQPIAGAAGLYYRANTPISASATAPSGFQFALWGPPTGSLFHAPQASNRSSNQFVGPVSIGLNYVLADWVANLTSTALAKVKAEHSGGEFTGAITTRVDGTNNTDQNLPTTSFLWATGEAREFQAKPIFRGLTSNVRYKFVAWEGGPTATTPERIIVAKPVGGVNDNVNYTARYIKQFKAITEIDNSSASCGSVTLDRAGPDEGFFNFGDSITATYNPPAGMVIVRWNGNFVGSSNQASYVVTDIPHAAPEINTVAEPLRISSVSKNQFSFGAPIEFDIVGSGFTASSEVYVANVRRSTVLVGVNQLRVTIPAADTPNVGKAVVQVANRVNSCSALAYSAVDIKSSGAVVTAGGARTGWWWNKDESGRGFFMERRGDALFIAGYYYEADGRPTWFTASGPFTGTTFSARATTLKNGQTLEGNFVAPVAGADLGPITLSFAADANVAAMNWPGGTTQISNFVFGGSGVGTGENGWWWNANENGRGYSIEVQGNTLFMVSFMYDTAGNPVWYYTSGTMQTSAKYTGRLLTFRGGQVLGGPYKAPTSTDTGSISIDFNSADQANMILPSGKNVAITRFRF
jgi:Astacin (Peptidase family M12A)